MIYLSNLKIMRFGDVDLDGKLNYANLCERSYVFERIFDVDICKSNKKTRWPKNNMLAKLIGAPWCSNRNALQTMMSLNCRSKVWVFKCLNTTWSLWLFFSVILFYQQILEDNMKQSKTPFIKIETRIIKMSLALNRNFLN